MEPTRLAEHLHHWSTAMTAAAQELAEARVATGREARRLAEDEEAELAVLEQRQGEERTQVTATHEQQRTRLDETMHRRTVLLERIEEQRQRAIVGQRLTRMRELEARDQQVDDDSVAELTVRRMAFERAGATLGETLDALRPQLATLSRHLDPEPQETPPISFPEGCSAEARLARLHGLVAELPEKTAGLTRALRRHWLHGWQALIVYGLILGLHGIAAALLLIVSGGHPPFPLLLGLAVILLVSCGLRLETATRRRAQCRRELEQLIRTAQRAEASLPPLLALGQQQLDVQGRMSERARMLLAHQEAVEQARSRVAAWARRRMAGIERRVQQLGARQFLRHQEACERWQAQRQQALSALDERQRRQTKALRARLAVAHEQAIDGAEDRIAARLQALESCRDEGIAKLEAMAAERPAPPYQTVSVGELDGTLHGCAETCSRLLPERPLRLPLELGLPLQGQLWLRSDSRQGRDTALAFLRAAALRLLEQLPPGRLRLTVFDPVGLGQGFAGFLPLIEQDERLLGPKIWTRSQEIEERLGELVAHSEVVIQKHLQQRHPDVAHYNAGAGELAAPYHLLILLDAPEGIRETAQERLRKLLTSGPRCGVMLWLHQHGQELLPASAIDGWALRADDDGLQVANPGLAGWRAASQSSEATTVDASIAAIGTAARATSRVAISFRAGMPEEDAVWSADSAASLRVPIGRCGAEKLQHLELGRGMAQHLLIGGRTGSGKSTLLHVLITNACLWYGPDQLQLSLIDFKKGVEFRPYARAALPHARVVAIESDREFALSVLEDIDQELDRRGRLFRERGVQNLQQYRATGGEPLPRHLLVVDEFHEFFADDDAIARSAALLLDRLVRQGRAFGVHAVLGSQSLAGCYALGKSTLGQIAVRLALQCNEADSQLLLSDDNPAARYLERPGEGIYNDRSGLPEGNQPFQTFWLEEDERDELLTALRSRAGHTAPGPVVFEGNAPASLAANQALRQQPEDGGWRCWLGEPNALAAPAAVDLQRGGSPHLLIVGQHREAACGIAAATLLATLRQHGPELRVDLFDATNDQRFATLVEAVDQRLPSRIRRLDAGKLDAWGEGLANTAGPRLILVLGLDAIPVLAEPEEDPFGLARGEGSSRAGSGLARLLGAAQADDCHALVWCASLGGLQRSLQRRTRQALTRRVCFQMSPADSNELLDDGSAGRLGLYHAVLAEIDGGRRCKFRPYSLPTVDELDDLLPVKDLRNSA